MASVKLLSQSRWSVYLALLSALDREVTVELRMNKATAKNLAHAGACHVSALNPRHKNQPTKDVGSAVLGILSSVEVISRLKDRVANSNQREVIEHIDSEVDAARTRSPAG